MTLYPDVLVRAQNEIDEVVGRERMPNFDDEGSLPYVNALIKEVLRWRPVLPLSMTHLAFLELELIYFMRRFAEEMRAGRSFCLLSILDRPSSYELLRTIGIKDTLFQKVGIFRTYVAAACN